MLIAKGNTMTPITCSLDRRTLLIWTWLSWKSRSWRVERCRPFPDSSPLEHSWCFLEVPQDEKWRWWAGRGWHEVIDLSWAHCMNTKKSNGDIRILHTIIIEPLRGQAGYKPGMGQQRRVSVCRLKLVEGCWRTHVQTSLMQHCCKGAVSLNRPGVYVKG